MRFVRKACLRLATVLVTLGTAVAGVTVNPALPPDAAATVDGQLIPKALVETFLKNDREALALDPATDTGKKALAELPADILDELIDRTLIDREVRARGLAPTDAQLDADERNMVTFCGGPARYDIFLAQNGFDRARYRETVLRTKANGKALIAALTGKLDTPDTAVRAYYDGHAADPDFQWPERVAGAHILINAQPDVLAAALEQKEGLKPGTPEMDQAVARETERRATLAAAVREKAAAPGADFAVLAKEHSDDVGSRERGGSLATFAHGVHPVALDDAFFKLPAGEVGPTVVRTEYGFHVLRVSARFPAGRKTFDEAAPEIRRRLLQTEAAKVLRDWLAQARASAAIVVRAASDLPGSKSR